MRTTKNFLVRMPQHELSCFFRETNLKVKHSLDAEMMRITKNVLVRMRQHEHPCFFRETNLKVKHFLNAQQKTFLCACVSMNFLNSSGRQTWRWSSAWTTRMPWGRTRGASQSSAVTSSVNRLIITWVRLLSGWGILSSTGSTYYI